MHPKVWKAGERMQKIMNRPETVVMEMCSGIANAHPELEFIQKYKIIKKRKIDPNKVSLISGGGSGHEPAHAGYVGKGMLDAAVCGDVFASPSQVQVYQALKATAGSRGTLMIIKNYSGDMMNFRNAAFLAEEDGISVDYVKVEDDIAVQDSLYTVGRRGVAGTVFVHKCAGAAAEKGMDLPEVKRIAQKAADRVRSLGFAFSSCTVPAAGKPTFEISDGEMEFGVGIHGEPGTRRERTATADELAERMVPALLDELNVNDEEVSVLINGFGATPLQELYLFNYAVEKVLAEHGIKTYRVFVGNFMTSIDMLGASVSLLKMDEELKEMLDAPSEAPGFRVTGPSEPPVYTEIMYGTEDNTDVSFKADTTKMRMIPNGKTIDLDAMVYLVDKMAEIIIENEQPWCELDSHAGDGDFGQSVAKGFRQVKREWSDVTEHHTDTIGDFIGAVSMIIMENCGGASGPIWGSAFRSAGKCAGDKKKLTVSEFAEMLQAAAAGVQATGERSFGRGAVVGDKTLIDALVPCADEWTACAAQDCDLADSFARAAKKAAEGAAATAEHAARMGRAGTVGERSIGYPDAGAYALGQIFTELADIIA